MHNLILLRNITSKLKIKLFTLLFNFISIFFFSQFSNAQLALEIESGSVFTNYNNVKIPGDKGTYFSLKNDLRPNTELYIRLKLNYTFKKHTVSFLYAPLKVNSKGYISEDIRFTNITFQGNSVIKSIYKFNSYRITYRFDIIKKSNFECGIGVTAKIRDAYISLASDTLYAIKENIGFVPLINFRILWEINDNFGFKLDGDALAAPQGRAEDIIVSATYKLSDRFKIYAGCRIVEGGADNVTVYNFAMFSYLSIGFSWYLFD